MTGIFGIIVFISGLIMTILSKGSVRFSSGQKSGVISQKGIGILIMVFGIIIIIFSAITTINAGEIGIMVVFGKTLDRQLYSGLNIKNIFAEVIKFPIRLQEFTMSIATEEGERFGDDSISALTKDQLMGKNRLYNLVDAR